MESRSSWCYACKRSSSRAVRPPFGKCPPPDRDHTRVPLGSRPTPKEWALSDFRPVSSNDRPQSYDFQTFLRNRNDTIASRGREAGFFSHRPTKGSAREWVLRDPLQEVLPERYGVTGAEVRSTDGTVSTQWDLVVYDRLETPRLYASYAAVALPIEGILAAISVKSKVDRDAIQDASEAAGVLRSMPRQTLPPKPPVPLPGEHWPRPAVFLFGFQGLELATLQRHMFEAGEGEGSPKVLNGAFVLDKGAVVATDLDGIPSPGVQSYRIANASAGGCWGLFVGFLWSALVYARGRPTSPNLRTYIRAAELLDPAGADGEMP